MNISQSFDRAQLLGGDHVRQRAACLRVGDEHRLLGRQNRRGLGHEVDAAEHDGIGVGHRGAPTEFQRITDEVGDVLHLADLVVVR